MKCSTCDNEAEFIGNDYNPECDECYRTNYRFEPKKAPSISEPWVARELSPDEQQHKLAVEGMHWHHVRQDCLRRLNLPVVINTYRVITNVRDYADSFLRYADEHGVVIPNRAHFERMRDGK
jgi:hypothetical protein